MIKEAIGLMLEDIPVKNYPKPSLPQDIPVEHGQFIMMVVFDKLAYDKNTMQSP